MKKTVSLMLCLFLIFSSVNFAFADFTTTDSNNLTTIKNTLSSGGALYNIINGIAGRLAYSGKNVANWLSDIENHLATTLYQNDGNTSRSIAWWVKEAVLDLDTIAGTGSGSMSYNLLEILNQLSYFSSGGARQSWLQQIELDLTNNGVAINTIKTNIQAIASDMTPIKSAVSFIPGISAYFGNFDTRDQVNGFEGQNGGTSVTVRQMGANGTVTDAVANFTSLNWRASIATFLMYLNNNLVRADGYQLNGYNNLQNYRNWQTLALGSFTPTSQTTGTYTWLKLIQEPIARLAYVHASDEEIAARQKAAANQTAVVNNFIDSSGSGAAPASSFGDVASMSSGYTSNMGTDASASGIWNIFNSNNFGWFSQETADQLDTTTASTRKGFSKFETPLLDQQIADIYKELGVDVDD